MQERNIMIKIKSTVKDEKPETLSITLVVNEPKATNHTRSSTPLMYTIYLRQY